MEKFLFVCCGIFLAIEVIKLPFAAMMFMICYSSFLSIWLWWDIRTMKRKHREELEEKDRKIGNL